MLVWIYIGFWVCFVMGRAFELERQWQARLRGTGYLVSEAERTWQRIGAEVYRMFGGGAEPEVQLIEERVKEINGVIDRVETEIRQLVDAGAGRGAIMVQVEFAETLRRRRRLMMEAWPQDGAGAADGEGARA